MFTGPNATELRKQLFAGVRAVRFERKSTKTHEVYTATPKDDVKELYGESPDLLDAAVMACWVADGTADELHDDDTNPRSTATNP